MLANKKLLLFLASVLIVGGIVWGTYSKEEQIDFNTQVKPILNKRCISCHGGVKQSGELSMMTREEILKAGESGNPAVVPGDPDASELYLRLITEEEEEKMPYKEESLPEDEIEILRKWIAQGAEWGVHWAFKPVENVEVPKAVAFGSLEENVEAWAKHPIDQFILAELKNQGLKPSKEADRNRLLRRVSLDIIGLPAPASLRTQFLETGNYEALVDSLLASPHFGERWASVWLDLARYADSKGAERDANRTIWEYRDWLIRAFNKDLPYNEFLTHQLAGDLLPNLTDAEYIATGFHRNTVTNDEGGTDNEEFRLAAVMDRTNTTWEALMGSTFACTQCHGHPYDPIKHEEYYEFLAFFNNSLDNDTHPDYPWLRKLSEEQKTQLQALRTWLIEQGHAKQAEEVHSFIRTWQPVYYSLLADSFTNAEIYDTKYLAFRNNAIARLAEVDLTDKNQLIFRYSSGENMGRWTLHLDSPDGQEITNFKVRKTKGWEIVAVDLAEVEGRHDLFFRFQNPNLKTATATGISFDWFYFNQQLPKTDSPEQSKYEQIYWDLVRAETEHTLIMVENPKRMQRKTYVWDRGNWLAKMQEVQADVPDIFEPLPEDAPNNRLGLAMWLTDERHPLTSRTMVNRVWEQLMGQGLAITLEDLGTQGIPPTHPELLEYLSWQFMHDYEWSVKRLVKEIVLSATYRQDSKMRPELLEQDQFNYYYARASRVRLSAEQLRDQTLAVSGLLSDKMYGPSVMPYQPDNIWSTPYNSENWKISEGEDRYRRSVYTFWKRSAPHPALTTFDAANRELCSARRIRTNTPLQALLTLNDASYLEAAVNFAMQVQVQNRDPKQQIALAYETAIGDSISDEKLATLHQLYEAMRADYNKNEAAVSDILSTVEADFQSPEIAAMAIVCNTIMNLDEFVVRG